MKIKSRYSPHLIGLVLATLVGVLGTLAQA